MVARALPQCENLRMTSSTLRPLLRPLACALVLSSLTACSYMPQWASLKAFKHRGDAPGAEALAVPKERPEVLLALTEDHTLVTLNAGQPGQLLGQVPLKGLLPGEKILGMDFRVARGQLFALSSTGRLLRIEPTTGQATPVGSGVALPPSTSWGVDFNPTVDRIRVVNDEGANLRLHPDTGTQVDGDAKTEGLQTDGRLSYAPSDLLQGRAPRVTAAAYTYNKDNDKLTTNYAIDAAAGYLVVQGSVEGATPVVSPNTGLLQSVGPLLIERFDQASFDISDVNNAAYLVTSRQGSVESRLYEVDLGSGVARLIGSIGAGQQIRALAIVP